VTSAMSLAPPGPESATKSATAAQLLSKTCQNCFSLKIRCDRTQRQDICDRWEDAWWTWSHSLTKVGVHDWARIVSSGLPDAVTILRSATRKPPPACDAHSFTYC
jgi:hypothetical protein